MRTNNQLCKQT